MSKENLSFWNQFNKPPKQALKQIKAGRLKNFSSINPQWRLKALTQAFGAAGVGWTYAIQERWTEEGSDGQVCVFVQIGLKVKVDGEWSEWIPGIGGSMLIAKEKAGLHTSDEAFKMALTDAISVACKSLGVAADIYEGNFDGDKYQAAQPSESKIAPYLVDNLQQLITDTKSDEALFKDWILQKFDVTEYIDLTEEQFDIAVQYLEKKKARQIHNAAGSKAK